MQMQDADTTQAHYLNLAELKCVFFYIKALFWQNKGFFIENKYIKNEEKNKVNFFSTSNS